MDAKLIFDFILATENAAIAAHRWYGLGDSNLADQAAVDAMRKALNKINMDGTVVIGEGERDKAPMLYIGEKVGTSTGKKLDIALDPLECTDLLVKGKNNSLAVLAVADSGGFLNAPDVYMEKIAIGINTNEQIINLDNSIKQNLSELAKFKKCNISDLSVTVLDRTRHEEIIAKLRELNIRVKLIQDGDVAGIIATTMQDANIDMYVGTGGAPEGVLAAAALRSLGGQMCGRLIFKDDSEKERAKLMGIKDINKQYRLNDLASGDVVFIATGVTNSSLLRGIEVNSEGNVSANTIVMDSSSNTLRKMLTTKKITIEN